MIKIVFQIIGGKASLYLIMLQLLKAIQKKIKLDPFFIPYTEINFQWNRAPNVKKVIQILEENVDKYLHDLSIHNAF